jgi:hypothetical protein
MINAKFKIQKRITVVAELYSATMPRLKGRSEIPVQRRTLFHTSLQFIHP